MEMSHIEFADDARDILHDCSKAVSERCVVPLPGTNAPTHGKENTLAV